MLHVVAKEAKDRFGQLLTAALKEPIVIDKNRQSAAVIMSTKEYERLEKIKEDFLKFRAQIALKKGFVGFEESEDLLKDLLKA